MGRQNIRGIISLLLTAALCMHVCTVFTVEAKETTGAALKQTELLTGTGLKNPGTEELAGMDSGQQTIWDCVWFGSYPQAEVVPSAADFHAVEKDLLKNGDLIENETLYTELLQADESAWNENNDIELDGKKYHRMQQNDATFPVSAPNHYQWEDSESYHYFKYEPIKWRVLNTDGNQALLLSDLTLDTRQYNQSSEAVSVDWETCSIRSWLNGYGAPSNTAAIDYSGRNFLKDAFSQEEQAAIITANVVNTDNLANQTEGGADTQDKLFLLSESELWGESAIDYGFAVSRWTSDEARRSRSSLYAKAMGVTIASNPVYKDGASWWLRSPGQGSEWAQYVGDGGEVYPGGGSVQISTYGVRPALRLDLSSAQHTYAGTASSCETEKEADGGSVVSGLHNPRINAAKGAAWDCVLFGSYPQAVVVSSLDTYTSIDKDMLKDGDVIEDSVLYEKLQNASGWSINDITIDGNKYRRVKNMRTDGLSGGSGYYQWPDANTYHYFKYEPIKWRVLNVSGNQALLLSDKALDSQLYDASSQPVTWQKSTIRSWLNGYGGKANQKGQSYLGTGMNFFKSAFDADEREAILNVPVKNADSVNHGADGGNDTKDKVFFLSEAEACGSAASSYGFILPGEENDETRRCYSSAYAKAVGIYSNTGSVYKGNCWWWLRSPGDTNRRAANVHYEGRVEYGEASCSVAIGSAGVRPALYLNLSAKLPDYAGTVSIGEAGGADDTTNQTDVKEKVSKITISGISGKIAAGKKIKLTAKVMPSNASNRAVAWESSDSKIAAVNASGVVSVKKKAGGKSVTITAAARDGSGVKAVYRIKSMKGVVKKITLSGKKTVKVNKTLKLKARVTATKKANKKLLWTSSNPNYASVDSSGKVKAKIAGKNKRVKITAMATDGSNKKKSITITIR